jgi:hypothetical protein
VYTKNNKAGGFCCFFVDWACFVGAAARIMRKVLAVVLLFGSGCFSAYARGGGLIDFF